MTVRALWCRRRILDSMPQLLTLVPRRVKFEIVDADVPEEWRAFCAPSTASELSDCSAHAPTENRSE